MDGAKRGARCSTHPKGTTRLLWVVGESLCPSSSRLSDSAYYAQQSHCSIQTYHIFPPNMSKKLNVSVFLITQQFVAYLFQNSLLLDKQPRLLLPSPSRCLGAAYYVPPTWSLITEPPVRSLVAPVHPPNEERASKRSAKLRKSRVDRKGSKEPSSLTRHEIPASYQ